MHNISVPEWNIGMCPLSLSERETDPGDATLDVDRSFRLQINFEDNDMLHSIDAGREDFDPSNRGYHAIYRDGEINHCPGCGRTHWLIGRLSAECAFCTTALPLKEIATQNPAPQIVFFSSRPSYAELAAA
ncbi:MAG: hypothetical protein ABIS39_06750 [Sphingomicrobium sp.]